MYKRFTVVGRNASLLYFRTLHN